MCTPKAAHSTEQRRLARRRRGLRASQTLCCDTSSSNSSRIGGSSRCLLLLLPCPLAAAKSWAGAGQCLAEPCPRRAARPPPARAGPSPRSTLSSKKVSLRGARLLLPTKFEWRLQRGAVAVAVAVAMEAAGTRVRMRPFGCFGRLVITATTLTMLAMPTTTTTTTATTMRAARLSSQSLTSEWRRSALPSWRRVARTRSVWIPEAALGLETTPTTRWGGFPVCSWR
mmetsp:Transcript_68149/g.127735  ORF Transcript_68149/g.127735 Transcript_68149/m.127735 type:complete len:227 (-) Transcript_68149:134-814(-)